MPPNQKEKVDPRIDKRRVTMTSAIYKGLDNKGQPFYETHVAEDFVPPDILDAYVARARTTWQAVEVSDEPDAGPAGYDGRTSIPHDLPVPHAGTMREAEGEELKKLQENEKKKGGGGGTGLAKAMPMMMMLNLMFLLAFLTTSLRFAIQTATMKSTLSDAYKGAATFAALYSTAPTTTQGTELTGGAPAYARIATTWGSSTAGVVSTGAMVFNVASGGNVAGAGVHNSATVNTAYLDGASVTPQAFASQGTYSLTLTYTQT